MNRILTAVLDGPQRLIFVDVTTGATVNSFQLDGTLTNGPIVVGDMCTLTIEMYNKKKETRVYRMSDGAVINRFSTA